MALRLVADHAARLPAGEVDAHRHAVDDLDRRRAVGRRVERLHETVLLLQTLHEQVARDRPAAAQAQLAQARALPHQHAEGARRDLGVEHAAVLLLHLVEGGALVGDEAREDVEPAGRALRVAHRRGAMAQVEPFEQRDDVDAALFQHAARGDVHLVHRELVELGLDRALAGQEAGTDAVRDRTEAQVEAGGLELLVDDRLEREDLLPRHHRPKFLARQDAGRVGVGRSGLGGEVESGGVGGGGHGQRAGRSQSKRGPRRRACAGGRRAAGRRRCSG